MESIMSLGKKILVGAAIGAVVSFGVACYNEYQARVELNRIAAVLNDNPDNYPVMLLIEMNTVATMVINNQLTASRGLKDVRRVMQKCGVSI